MSRSLLAGIVSGSFMGVVFLGVGAVALVLQPSAAAQLTASTPRKIGPFGVSPTVVAVIAVAVWSILGVMLGLAHYLVTRAFPSEGLGSPSAAFTISITAVAVAIFCLVALWKRQCTGMAIAVGISFAVIFGWLLPWLAV